MTKTRIRRVASIALALSLVHAATLGTAGVAGGAEATVEVSAADMDVPAPDIVEVSLAEGDVVGGQYVVVQPLLQFMCWHCLVDLAVDWGAVSMVDIATCALYCYLAAS